MTYLSIISFDKTHFTHDADNFIKFHVSAQAILYHLLDPNISLFMCVVNTFVSKQDLASFLVVLVPLSVHCSGFKVSRQCQPFARQRQRDLTMLPRMPWHCCRSADSAYVCV